MDQLLSSVASRVLGLIGMIGVAGVLLKFAMIPDQMAAGDQLQTYANQSKTFMSAYFSTGGACGLPAGGLVTATLGGVQEYDAACIGMPASWKNTNVYGQSHVLKVWQPNPGANPAKLYGIVQTCGGDTLNDTDVAKAAAQAEPDGGMLLSSDLANFHSAGGKWDWPAAAYNTAGCPNVAGHLAALIVLDGGQVVPPYLHRYAVGSTTEPNTMHTNLLSAGYDATGFRDITATRNITAGQDLTASRDVAAGRNVVASQDVTANRNVTAGQKVIAGGGLRTDLMASQGGSCSDNGLIGRDTAGNLYTCFNGSWDNIRHGTLQNRLAGNVITNFWDTGNANYQTSTDNFYLDRPGVLVAQSWISAGSAQGESQVGAHLIIDGDWCGFARHTDPSGRSVTRTTTSCVRDLAAGWHSIYGITGNMVWNYCIGCAPPIWRYEVRYAVFANQL